MKTFLMTSQFCHNLLNWQNKYVLHFKLFKRVENFFCTNFDSFTSDQINYSPEFFIEQPNYLNMANLRWNIYRVTDWRVRNENWEHIP